MATTYEAFTKKQKSFVVGSAIFAVFMSLIFAAWIMQDALRSTQFSQRDQEVVNQLLGDTKDPQQKSILRAQAIDAVANLKQLANRQSILIVACAGAFALAALGFALFLLGADGAFQIQAEQGKGGIKLLLAGTAPGILCFVLAVALMGLGIAYRSSANLAPAHFPKQIMGASDTSAPRALTAADNPAANTALAQKAKEASEQRNARQEAADRAAEKAAAAKVVADKATAEKAATDKAAADKAVADKAAADKAVADKAAADKAAADKLIAEEMAAAKLAAAKSAAAKAAAEKATISRLAAEKSAAEKRAAQKAAAEQAADAKLAAARVAAKAAADKASAKAAADNAAAKLAAVRANAAKLAAERAAADRSAGEKALADALKMAAEKASVEKAAAEKLAADRRAADSAVLNKLAADKAASDKMRVDRAAADRGDIANLTAQRIAAASEPAELYKRALALRKEGETDQALALLRYASSNGHGPSSRFLAAIYRDGAPDVRANFRQAERYQALADAQGGR